MKMTLTKTADNYTVHELLCAGDPVTPCLPATRTAQDMYDANVLHVNEIAGEDLHCDQRGLWTSVSKSSGPFGEVLVDAGPIAHRGQLRAFILAMYNR